MSTVLRAGAIVVHRKVFKQILPSFSAVKRFYSVSSRICALENRSYAISGFNNYNQKRFVASETGRRTYCQQEKERWTDLTYEQLNSLLESRDIVLIDVREPKEIEANGKIPESVNIPLGRVKEALALAPDKFQTLYGASLDEEKIVFHCQKGGRSFQALSVARELGFEKARHFPGGYEEWSKKRENEKQKASASGS